MTLSQSLDISERKCKYPLDQDKNEDSNVENLHQIQNFSNLCNKPTHPFRSAKAEHKCHGF